MSRPRDGYKMMAGAVRMTGRIPSGGRSCSVVDANSDDGPEGDEDGDRSRRSVLRVVLNTNAIDGLADDPATLAEVEAAVESGALELIALPDAWTEVAAMTNQEKAERLRRLTTISELPVAVWGRTRWGLSVWGSEQIGATFDDAKGQKMQHYVDAQVLVTAQRLGVPLVTADKALIRKALRNGVSVMSSAQVIAVAREGLSTG